MVEGPNLRRENALVKWICLTFCELFSRFVALEDILVEVLSWSLLLAAGGLSNGGSDGALVRESPHHCVCA